MTEHLQPVSLAKRGRCHGHWRTPPRSERGFAVKEGLTAQDAKIKITWHGQRITRMVFPSGTTVEFLA